MGTSSSNSGPKGKVPLLPNWALDPGDGPLPNNDNEGDDNDNADSNDKGNENTDNPVEKSSGANETQDWNSAKRAMGKFVNGGQNRENGKAAMRKYVKTFGGSKSATRAAYSGVSAGIALGGFLGGIVTNGYQENLRKYGLADCIGKSSEEVLARIADEIAPIGSTSDDAIARSAIIDTLDKLYEKLIGEGKDLDSLSNMDISAIKQILIGFISAYIFKKCLYELGQKLEKNELSEKEVVQKENEMKLLIETEVEITLRDEDINTFDLGKGDGKKKIEKIFELAYSIL